MIFTTWHENSHKTTAKFMKFLDAVRVSSLLLAIAREIRIVIGFKKIFRLQLSLSLLLYLPNHFSICHPTTTCFCLLIPCLKKIGTHPHLLPVETSTTYLGMRICKISRCLKIKNTSTWWINQLSESLAGTPFFWNFVLFLLIFLQILNFSKIHSRFDCLIAEE